MTAKEKYKKALKLYRKTDRSITDISRECGVTRAGFASYICRCHRKLMFARHGCDAVSPKKKMKGAGGQSPMTREKYRDAIAACDSEQYIHLNVSQIARMFNLDGSCLGKQLRAHYPEIVERRENERRKRGISDNYHRGARPYAVNAYSAAVQMLETTDMTIGEVAGKCKVSFSGLREHILQYHKNLVKQRMDKRHEGERLPKIGRIGGNGAIRLAKEEQNELYAEALELYRTTSLPMKEICAMTGKTIAGFGHYLRMWHKDLIFKRRGVELPEDASDRESLDGVKRSSPWVAEKYSSAIAELASGGISVEAVARKYGFIPEVFRTYLKKNHYELWHRMGMIELSGGRRVLRRSFEKYKDAIEAYETSAETLKSIAKRMNIPYNSIGGFIHRNMPEVIERHNRITGTKAINHKEKQD